MNAEITNNPHCVLNPDAIPAFILDDPSQLGIYRRFQIAVALLPNFEKYFPTEYPAAKRAVELWIVELEKAGRFTPL